MFFEAAIIDKDQLAIKCTEKADTFSSEVQYQM